MAENNSGHAQHERHARLSRLMAKATGDLKPYHDIVELSADALPAADGRAADGRAADDEALSNLIMETDILKATLLESKWRLDVGDLSDYQALIGARDAVDAYIQRVRPYATFAPRTVDWSMAPPPTAELELLIQIVVLLVLDLELIEAE